MTDPRRLAFAPADANALPLHVVHQEDAAAFLADRPPAVRAWLEAQGWSGAAGDPVVLPGVNGSVAGAVIGLGDARARARSRFTLARAAAKLPEGTWVLHGELSPAERDEAALAWLLAGYRFDRYRAAKPPRARLVAPKGCDAHRLEIIANAEALTRDLINTPAADMGPDELEAAVQALAARHGAKVEVIGRRRSAGAQLSDDSRRRPGQFPGAAPSGSALGRCGAYGHAGRQGGLFRLPGALISSLRPECC